ncbi:MAG: ankyrin repeat domain-containing protein [Alphaproteobacteria bacterium]|nr:ankyrin repeat domain-containing protein [Alphaproteobacteria bacterium]
MTETEGRPTAGRAARRRAWAGRAGALAIAIALAAPAFAQDAGEIEFWKSVSDSKNPAELQAYLNTYPNGRFAPLARLRITQLGGKPAAAAQEPAAPSAQHAAPASPAVKETPVATPEHTASLGAAIRAGDMTAVQQAVASGVDVNAWDERGMPPVGLAALLGKPDIIAYLAANGADVNRNDRFGFTPLMNAAIRGQPEAARVLLALGADPALKGINGNDPLGAARPNGATDRRYAGKLAVTKILESAIAARSNGAVTPRREGRAEP